MGSLTDWGEMEQGAWADVPAEGLGQTASAEMAPTELTEPPAGPGGLGAPLQASDASMGRRRKWRRLGTALLVLSVISLGGLAAYQFDRISSLEQQFTLLEGDVRAEIEREIDALEQSDLALGDRLDGVRDEVTKANRAAVEIDSSEQPSDLTPLIERVRRSTATVVCGSSLGSAWSIDILLSDELAEYSSAMITNYHVVEDCTFDEDSRHVRVTANDSNLGGYVWDWDEENDLAMIATVAEIPALATGPRPDVGWWVLAVGSPFGLEGTATSGHITNIEGDNLLTDAAINHGNSGGPLVDNQGRVLGVTSAKVAESDNSGLVRGLPQLCSYVVVCSTPYW